MTQKPSNPLATILTIAGSDPSSGAGIQADLKTIQALGGYALTVPTALTSQNSLGVADLFCLPPEVVRSQLETLLSDYDVQAIKIGMLGNRAILETVIEVLTQHPVKHLVLDTVLVSSSGRPLLTPDALSLFTQSLLPLADVITPNIPELNTLLNQTFAGQASDIPYMAEALFSLGVKAAVIKGGHSIEVNAIDYLVCAKNANLAREDQRIQTYSTARLDSCNTHGTGCTYSAAIATELAKGHSLPDAVKEAKNYLFAALSNASQAQPGYLKPNKNLSRARKGGLNHFYAFNHEERQK